MSGAQARLEDDPRYAAWRVLDEEFPRDGDASIQARFLLRYAILAPSTHNTQPWRFTIDGDRVRFWVEPRRWLRVADPARREMFTSVGCALETFLIATEHFGRGHDVRYVPDPALPDLAAEVQLRDRAQPSTRRPAKLFEAIRLRQTNRNWYQPRPVPIELQQNLQAAASDHGIWLHRTDDLEVKERIDALVMRADATLFADRGYREELARWIAEGLLSSSWLMSKLEAFAVAHVNLGKPVARRDHAGVMSAPVLALIAAERDDPRSQLLVGQAFARVYLTASQLDLALQPLSQLLEVPEVRAELEKLFPLDGCVAMQPFRIGYAEREKGHSPRRPLSEVLDGD